MDPCFYAELTQTSLKGELLPKSVCLDILTSPSLHLLRLLDAVYEVRKAYAGNEVQVHIINNIQNGFCPEDCHYCAQAKTSQASIDEYPLKNDKEILAEAKQAYESGAFRYCMVSAGRGPSEKRVEQLSNLIREIKSRYPIEVCVSAGLMNESAAAKLKAAGLDRLNHNLNTSEENYPNICTTHTFADRLNTLTAAKKVGLEICSGMIAGMGETAQDIVEIAYKLRELKARSIPINFLIPIEGNLLIKNNELTPQYCLRILCLFRLLNPTAEIRMAAGREGHLRSMEVLGLYAANSLFLDGYLNTKGERRLKTLQMIKDAGFVIKSEIPLNELLAQEEKGAEFKVDDSLEYMKGLEELRPFKAKD